MMLVFLLDRLRVGKLLKLLKLYQTEGRISSNLLKQKNASNPARKQASCAADIRGRKKDIVYKQKKKTCFTNVLITFNYVIKTCCLKYIKIILIIYIHKLNFCYRSERKKEEIKNKKLDKEEEMDIEDSLQKEVEEGIEETEKEKDKEKGRREEGDF